MLIFNCCLIENLCEFTIIELIDFLLYFAIDKSRSLSCLVNLIFQRTLKYFPAKSCTPIMAKISQNIRHTNSTLKMDGIACTSAFTTTLSCIKLEAPTPHVFRFL